MLRLAARIDRRPKCRAYHLHDGAGIALRARGKKYMRGPRYFPRALHHHRVAH